MPSTKDQYSMGIYVESYVTHGAYVREDNSIGMIPKTSMLKEDFQKADCAYDGFGDLLNAGIAASEMGISMNKLKKAFQNMTGNEVRAVAISLPTVTPNEVRIRSAMQERLYSEDMTSKAYQDARIYEELELEGEDTRGIVKKAAELAELPRVEIVPKPLAIYAAYEGRTKNAVLKENEWGLILDWNEQMVCISVLQRKFGQLIINWQEMMENPARDINLESNVTEECLRSRYMQIENLMRMMFQDIQMQNYEISKVYLAGEWCNYNFVYSWMEDFMGICTECFAMHDMEFAAVKGAAYLAAKNNNDLK